MTYRIMQDYKYDDIKHRNDVLDDDTIVGFERGGNQMCVCRHSPRRWMTIGSSENCSSFKYGLYENKKNLIIELENNGYKITYSFTSWNDAYKWLADGR